MTTQFRQISYIMSAEAEAPAAESSVDYRVDVVATVFHQIRDQWRSSLAHDADSRFVAPYYNVHAILDERRMEGYRNFFKAMDRYQVCTAGWNSEHSVAPSADQIENAAIGVANLILAGAQPPSPMLLDDGTIGAFWRSGQKYMSIDFETDGQHPWAGTDGEQYWAGVWEPSSELPPALDCELKSIAD